MTPNRSNHIHRSNGLAGAAALGTLVAALGTVLGACIVSLDVGGRPRVDRGTENPAADAGTGGVGSTSSTGGGGSSSSTGGGGSSSSTGGMQTCSEGILERCWVECVQSFVPECLHGGIPPMLVGIRTCDSGQWSECVVNEICDSFDNPCSNGATFPTTYICLDGSSRVGAYVCFGVSGAQCMTSYYQGWPPHDCPGDLCLGPGDSCLTDGEEQPCEVHCDSPQGPLKPGTRRCISYCGNNLAWGPCLTHDACLTP